MEIDKLTIGEARQAVTKGKEIEALLGGSAPAAKTLEQKRVVLVVDRGWIFAGDQSLTSDGYVRLSNAVHVFRWEELGFAKMIEEWKDKRVDLRKVADVEVPADAVVFRVAVPSGWGLK